MVLGFGPGRSRRVFVCAAATGSEILRCDGEGEWLVEEGGSIGGVQPVYRGPVDGSAPLDGSEATTAAADARRWSGVWDDGFMARGGRMPVVSAARRVPRARGGSVRILLLCRGESGEYSSRGSTPWLN